MCLSPSQLSLGEPLREGQERPHGLSTGRGEENLPGPPGPGCGFHSLSWSVGSASALGGGAQGWPDQTSVLQSPQAGGEVALASSMKFHGGVGSSPSTLARGDLAISRCAESRGPAGH